jgi:hypothetical protein
MSTETEIHFVCAYFGRSDECHECGFFNETGTRFCSTECEAGYHERVARMEAARAAERAQDEAFGAECERLRALGHSDAEINELTKGMP